MISRISLLMAALTLLVGACGEAVERPRAVFIRDEACGDTIEGVGVLIRDELVVTNAHVVAGTADSLAIFLANGLAAGVVVGFDPDVDLALIRLAGSVVVSDMPFGVAEAGDRGSMLLRDEDGVGVAIPYEVRRPITATGEDIYREGDVSRKAYEVTLNLSQGNSGAALVNDDGELIGIAFASSRTDRDLTYAIAASEVEAFLARTDPATIVDTGPCL